MWNMFVRGTQVSLNSTLSRAGVLTQIHIPNEIPPISATLTSLIMLTLEMIVFGIFMVAFRFIPPQTIAVLPLILILEFILILGLALPLSVLNIKFRDTQFIWGVVIQVGFFLTPIFYKIDILPSYIQSILVFDPMVQILNFAHNAVLYDTLPSVNDVAVTVGMTFIIFTIGYAVFRKLSNKIIEEI